MRGSQSSGSFLELPALFPIAFAKIGILVTTGSFYHVLRIHSLRISIPRLIGLASHSAHFYRVRVRVRVRG